MEWLGDEEIRDPVWGPSATILFGVVVFTAFAVSQVAVLVAFLFARSQTATFVAFWAWLKTLPSDDLDAVLKSGSYLAVATCVSTVVSLGLLFQIIWARRDATLSAYVGLQPVRLKTLLKSLLLVLALVVLWNNLTLLVRKPLVPVVLTEAYKTAGWLPLYWFAVIVAAPVFEELFFRGFLFSGLRRSRLGDGGAILLTALTWAATHTQYEAYVMGTVFAAGIVLGIARIQAGSLWPCIVMHGFANLAATIETALCVRGLWGA